MSTGEVANLHQRFAHWCRVNVTTPRILCGVGWLLLFVGVVMLVRAGIALRSPDEQKLEASATAAAAIVAIAGLLLTLAQQLVDKTDAISRFYLEEYRKGYDSAYAVLADAKPADPLLRMKWIAAARILVTARRVSDKVTVGAHRDVMYMDIPHQSQRFHPFFELGAAYYYGDNPGRLAIYPGAEGLNEAARQSTAPASPTRLNVHREVPERVIHTVWRAIQYPRRYADVLGDNFSDGDALFLPAGLRDYVEHSRRYRSANGVLYEGNAEVPPLPRNVYGDIPAPTGPVR